VAGLLENDRVAIVTETLAEIVLDNVRAVIANDGAWLTATRTTIRRRGMVGSDGCWGSGLGEAEGAA
jgi:hypothetical protein